MPSPADSLTFLDARIAALRGEIDAAQRVVERATADIKVLEQAKAVLSRSVPHTPPPPNVGIGRRRMRVMPRKTLAKYFPAPPSSQGPGREPSSEGAWQAVAIDLLCDGEAHSTGEIFEKVQTRFGDAVKYAAVASWLIRAVQSSNLAKDGRGRFRLITAEEEPKMAEMGFGTPAPLEDDPAQELSEDKKVYPDDSADERGGT